MCWKRGREGRGGGNNVDLTEGGEVVEEEEEGEGRTR